MNIYLLRISGKIHSFSGFYVSVRRITFTQIINMSYTMSLFIFFYLYNFNASLSHMRLYCKLNFRELCIFYSYWSNMWLYCVITVRKLYVFYLYCFIAYKPLMKFNYACEIQYLKAEPFSFRIFSWNICFRQICFCSGWDNTSWKNFCSWLWNKMWAKVFTFYFVLMYTNFKLSYVFISA